MYEAPVSKILIGLADAATTSVEEELPALIGDCA